MEQRYCVCVRPGYFGRNESKVYSAHKTLDAAKRAMRRHAYTDERNQTRLPCCVVLSHKRKGDVIYGDMFPEIVA